MQSKITKRYARRISYKFNSEEFMTEESKDIEYTTKEEYLEAHNKLAKAVKTLTQADLVKHSELLKEAQQNGDLVQTEDTTS